MLKVIYQDRDIIVVEKPAGIQSQSSRGFDKDMVSEIKKYLVSHGSERNPYVGVIHRLDQPVRGIMVFGLNKKATASLSEQMAKAGHMDKEYMALVCGKPEEKEAQLTDKLYFDKQSNTSFVITDARDKRMPEAKESRLRYETEAKCKGASLKGEPAFCLYFEKEIKRLAAAGFINDEEEYSLLKIHLLTGRHHQIRVQLKNAQNPILGDVRYNEAMSDYRGMPALCLCAAKLSFIHPTTGKRLSFLVNEDRKQLRI